MNHFKSRKTEQAKWTQTLAPKGTESDHSGSDYIMGDGQTIPGLKMAPKVFVIIWDQSQFGAQKIDRKYPVTLG